MSFINTDRIVRTFYVLIGLILVCGCSSVKDIYIPSSTSDIINLARKQIGDSYSYGAKGPNRFDCSGLVVYVYSKNGVNISGSASTISKMGKGKKLSLARPGDLIFYKKKGRVFHVSIISKAEHGKLWVIHSTSSRGVIEEEILSSRYWEPMIDKVISLNDLKN